jgi:tRNA A-37 threonylcarbamoyl transferase component Bud32
MPNSGYLDESVHWKVRTGQIGFAEPTYGEVASTIVESGLATEVGQRLGSGKEADVYLARDGGGLLAIKVYRQYRTAHRGGSAIRLREMGDRAVREFELLVYAWQGGAPVPRPGRRIENMFSMEYLGTDSGPAPMLRHAALEDPEGMARATEDVIVALAESGLVHTDLSPFNILVHRRRPWIIDLAAGLRVDRLGMPPGVRLAEALAALRHGTETLGRQFARWGAGFDGPKVIALAKTAIDRFRPSGEIEAAGWDGG